MKSVALLVILFVVLVPALLLIGFLVYNYRRNRRVIRTTQDIISDRDILLWISEQPDGLVSGQQLADKTGLSKSDAKSRLSQLHSFGVLKVHHAHGLKGYYGLAAPIDEKLAPELSTAPFLTVEDILKLFQHFDYRLTPQQLIMSTGLPLDIIKREVKYFHSQKILQTLWQSDQYGVTSSKIFVLQEPYRSNPDQFLDQQLDLNRAMETILRKEDLV